MHDDGHAAGEGEVEHVRGPGHKVRALKDVGVGVVPDPVDESDPRDVVRHVHQDAQQAHGNMLRPLAFNLELGRRPESVIVEHGIWPEIRLTPPLG